jgi:WD40 repeat protein
MRDYCPVIRALGAHVYHSTLVSMPSCRLRDLSSHEAGDVVLRTPRRGGFSREFTYMQGNITEPQLLVLSQDGSRIACCTNGSIYFGNTISGQMTVVAASVPLHPPLALVFSADGRQLLAADRHGHIHVIELNGLESTWADLPPAEQIHESTYAEGAVFSPDGNYCVFQIKSLTTSSYVADGPDPALFLRQVQANTPLYLLDDPGVFFYSLPVAFTPNNQYLIQACNWTIEIWDVARRILHVQGVQDHSVHDEESSIKAVVAVSNTICASLASDGAVLIWNINEGSILRKVLNADHSIDQVSLYSYPLALSTSCSGSLLGVVVKNTVTILDIAAEAPAVARHTFPADRSGYWSRTSIVLDESRSRMYVAGYGEPLLGWDYRAVLHPLQASTTSPGTVQCVSFSGDGCWLVSGTANGYLTIWQTDSGSQIAEHSGEGAVFAAAISSPDPKITLSIRSVSDDVTSPTLRFQASDTWTGEPKEVYGFRPPPVADVSVISPDGRFIALSMRFHSHGDRAILLIDASSGKTIVHVPDDDRYAYCNELVYTPDGHSLIDRRPYSVLIRDAQSLEVRHTCYPSGLLGVRAATMVSPCSSRVGLICQDRLRLCFQAWDIKSGAKVIDRAQLQPLEGLSHFKYPNQIDVCQWTPDHLVYVIQDCVATWDFDTSTPAAIHAWSETWTPNSICMSDDGSFFYAWCEDQRIRAWALASFDMERPLMELDTSTWTEKPTRWDLRCWFLISASHDDTSLHMLVRAQNIHVALKADLMTGHCVDIIPLGEQGSISAANVSFTESKMYVHCPQNTKGAYLLPWLAQIPFGEGGITAEWPQTAGDAFSLLQQALLQVWDPKTGEMKAVILWTEDGTRREVIPPSSPLRSPPNQGIQDRSLRIDYDPYSPLLHIHSTFLPKTHVVSLGIPPDRRPVGSGENREPIAIHEFLIAIGSTHGTVSIFDIEKAVEIAEATGPKESLEREDLKRDVDGMSC